MRGWPLYLLATSTALTTGCGAVFGIGDPEVGGGSCPIGDFDLCATQNPNGPIAFTTDVRIATDRDCSVVLYEPEAGSICVIYATEIDVAGSATVTGTGSRPLVFAATGAITIAGTLDVSSYYQMGAGAGSDPATCMIEREPTTDSMGAGGGGAGGSFGGKGGTGGNGATGSAIGGAPGDAVSPPAFPRGGCRGGASGSPFGGGPGQGGGVLWIVSGDQIALASTGRVLAAGAGGGPGFGFGGEEGGSGGHGGGSGGFLRVAAPAITIAGVVIANGGGGGEGGDPMTQGKPGFDGAAVTQPSMAGGGGSPAGGDGGNGATGTVLDGAPGSPSMAAAGAGGGGGGGGAGAIVLAAETLTTTGATISPPAM
jgi:hypothetical protein